MADKARLCWRSDTNIQVKTRSNTYSLQKFNCINLMYLCTPAKVFFMLSWFGLAVKEYFSKKLELARISFKPILYYLWMCNTGLAHSGSITQEATCTCVICLCTHIGVCMDLPHTSALPGSSAGDSSLPLGVGSSSSPQWGSKRITVIYVF